MSVKQITEAEQLARQWRAAHGTETAESAPPATPEEPPAAAEPTPDFDTGKQAFQRGDYAAALKQWRPLAEHGHATAQFGLGMMYANGHGVAKDSGEAVRWSLKAAEQGDLSAQYNLGNMCRRGQGVLQDHAEAVRWYRTAAVRGQALSQAILGVMYANGLGGPGDVVQSYRWLILAARQGNKAAAKNREIMAGRMAAEQIREAENLAQDWTPE